MKAQAGESTVEDTTDASPGLRLSWLVRFVSRILFRHIEIGEGAAEYVKALAKTSSLVYIVRYRSLFDVLLVTTALERAGLPRPVFVPDLPTFWLHPVSSALRSLVRWLGDPSVPWRARLRRDHRERCRDLVAEGRPILLFMRSRATGVSRARDAEARSRARVGAEYLREIVIGQWAAPQNVSFVPLAIARGRGYRRKESRLTSLVYTVQQAPGDVRRFLTFLWNRRDTSIVVGKDVQLREVVEAHRAEGADAIVRRLSRALQIFLYREERMVQGPTLLSHEALRDAVLSDPTLKRYIERTAWAKQIPEAKVRGRAVRYIDQMAANYNGLYISFLEIVLNWIWKRMFGELQWSGLDRVANTLKKHPVVLVPCHRSHFDYLILSYVFHQNFLSPPHIAAGDNLSFWPLGPIFRRAGAYFIRRSFKGDDLYKLVFRAYMTLLVREGYTQEFFIEGGRSRSGKVLTPKLGLLSAIVDAFLRGVRRDLYLVPVSIQYTRVVEEGAYQHELQGGAKEKESVGALLRARRLLNQDYGDVRVTFAEPISLAGVLADCRDELGVEVEDGASTRLDARATARRYQLAESLGLRILQDINAVSSVTDTTIAATVLLGAETEALRYQDFLDRALAMVSFLEFVGAPLARPVGSAADFGETRAFMEQAGMMQRLAEAPDVLYVKDDRRLSLDFYKNNGIHWVLVPCLTISGLRDRLGGGHLVAFVASWLNLYRQEFPSVGRDAPELEVERTVEYLRKSGALSGNQLDASAPLCRVLSGALDNFHEPYWVVTQVLGRLEAQGASEKVVLDRIAKQVKASALLGEFTKPEGNSSITIKNALQRFAEDGCVDVATRPGRIRTRGEKWVVRGPAFARLNEVGEQLRRLLRR